MAKVTEKKVKKEKRKFQHQKNSYFCPKFSIMITNILVGMVGPWQIGIIVVVVLLLFGGKKIPELMRGMGQGINEFKKGLNPEEEKKEKKEEEK